MPKTDLRQTDPLSKFLPAGRGNSTVDPLFHGLALVVTFGLAVGTVLSLGVVPVLYTTLFGIKPTREAV